MAGYSGTPLAKKLGIKSGHRVALVNAPKGFERTLDGLEAGVVIEREPKGKQELDVIVAFFTKQSTLGAKFGAWAKRLAPAGGFWIAWPKKASGVETDVSENLIRAIGLEAGLVDNKVCAIDQTWSGLRFVIRVKDRPKPAAPSKTGSDRA